MQYDFETIGDGKPFFHTLLAELSGFAYSPQAEVEKKLVEIGYKGTEVIFFQTDLTAGFIIAFPKVVVVVFRGTQTRREKLNNLNLYLYRTRFGRIHAGFQRTIDELAPRLIPIVVAMRGADKDIIATGHSRGGALALLLVTLLLANNVPANVVAFGAPRVGDVTFANNFRAPGEQLSHWTKFVPGPIAYVMTVVQGLGSPIFRWQLARCARAISLAIQRWFASLASRRITSR